MVKMDKHTVRHIVEDLLPLYKEGLVSDETKKWIEEQLKRDESLQKMAQTLDTPLEKEEIPITEEGNQDRVFKKIQRRLTLYQIIFIAISFLLALRSSLLNNSFGFILWYAVLGALIYLFYSDMKIVFYLSFIPIFFWSIVSGISDYFTGNLIEGVSFFDNVGNSLYASIFVSIIHYIFALLGSVIGLLIKKLFKKENTS